MPKLRRRPPRSSATPFRSESSNMLPRGATLPGCGTCRRTRLRTECRVSKISGFHLSQVLAAVLTLTPPFTMMAQSNQSPAATWLAHADLAPAFIAPASLKEWELQRSEVRSKLTELLGRLPPRPKSMCRRSVVRSDYSLLGPFGGERLRELRTDRNGQTVNSPFASKVPMS